jgi:hypothetical protein
MIAVAQERPPGGAQRRSIGSVRARKASMFVIRHALNALSARPKSSGRILFWNGSSPRRKLIESDFARS